MKFQSSTELVWLRQVIQMEAASCSGRCLPALREAEAILEAEDGHPHVGGVIGLGRSLRGTEGESSPTSAGPVPEANAGIASEMTAAIPVAQDSPRARPCPKSETGAHDWLAGRCARCGTVGP